MFAGMLLDRYISHRISQARKPADNGRLVAVFKSVSWRILGTLDTILISYMLTGTFEVALQIGGVEVISKMILYYLHERAWTHWAKSE